MWRVVAIAVAVLGLTATAAEALELKNVRAVYGPFGSVRSSNKFMQKDLILLLYDIDGLKINELGTVRYDVNLEVFDKKKETPNQQQFVLGGTKAISAVHIVLPADQKLGKYTAKITVMDKTSKEMATTSYDFEIVATDFGFIHVDLPAYGFVNNNYAGQLLVVGMGRDAKKQPDVVVNLRILDEQGKATFAKPLSSNIPKDLPEELVGPEHAVFPLTLFLTRAGHFHVEIEAIDKVGKKTVKLSFPIKVADPSAVK